MMQIVYRSLYQEGIRHQSVSVSKSLDVGAGAFFRDGPALLRLLFDDMSASLVGATLFLDVKAVSSSESELKSIRAALLDFVFDTCFGIMTSFFTEDRSGKSA